VGNYDSTGQHLLNECASDIIADATNPILAGEISQHSLLECTEKNTEPFPVGSATLEQHGIADCAVIGVAQPTQ
jgi:hypothetical protein